MKQIYSFFSKTLLIAAAVVVVNKANGQNETHPSPSSSCGTITQNFNSNNGGYTSPSTYGGSPVTDATFYYNSTRGYWTELGSTNPGSSTPANPNRLVSILSAAYPSPATPGSFDVGFTYIVPSPTTDQFSITLVKLTTDAQGQTTSAVVANTGKLTFSSYGTYSPYTDPVNPLQSGFQGGACTHIDDADIAIGPNISYQVSIVYYIAATNFTAFDNLSLNNIPQNIPLPVTLMGIMAKRTNNGVEAYWSVGTELNVKNYQIERSSNGSTFVIAGTVDAQGKSLYTFTDGDAPATDLFYRVRSIDINGTYKTSPIIKVGSSGNTYSNVLRLYPTPAQSQVTVEHKLLSANAKITVSSVDGKVLKVIVPGTGASHTFIDLTGITSGMYILRIDDGKGNTESTKFVKQ